MVSELHQLFNKQKRYSFPFNEFIKEIPLNGIYVIFENGEKYNDYDRIVRVGTHTGNNQLRSRLNQHFVNENKNRSIFRKNIGRCILNKVNNPYLSLWELDTTSRADKEKNTKLLDLVFEKELERQISNYIQSNLTFCVFEIDTKEDRLFWESRIVSTLARATNIKPSDNWLGNYSPKEKIKASGLWQVNELYNDSLSELEFQQLKLKLKFYDETQIIANALPDTKKETMQKNKKQLLREYSRAIVHMRQQKSIRRFGLVFGAGISVDFGFPSWSELIKRIAENSKVQGLDMLSDGISNSSISQLLFQKFKLNIERNLPPNFDENDKKSSFIQSEWQKVVHDALYKNIPINSAEFQKRDSYLKEYLNIIKNTRLTINYNFDDTLQILIAESRTKEEKKKSRGFRTVWNSDIQMYPENGVIYHPNGFLPRKLSEKPSDNLIFLEDSFGDQLIESAYGHYATLSYHLSQTTCLLIGISLEDATLKHLLRKNAKLHPGHVHYYVYYLDSESDLSLEHRKAIIDANFEVYNLVTLFLTKTEISHLGQLLSATDEEIEIMADELGVNTTYRFFLTGSVCAGKSTTLSNFRSLRTHDEWLDQRVAGMEKDPSFVNRDEKIQEIDYWVAEQWRAKNFILFRAKTPGLDIIDRCPLDAFAFTDEDKWKDKAIFTREIITPEKSSTPLCKGKIILLIGNPQTMSVRAIKLHKEVTSQILEYRQQLLKIIYNNQDIGIVEIDTKDKSVEQVSKEVSKIIHIDEYSECDLQARLLLIENEIIRPSGNSDAI